MKKEIRFGPAGIGGVKQTPKNLEKYNKDNIRAAEIPFTYQVWMNNNQAKEIGKITKKFNIKLSIHAHYWINLASHEKKKIEASKKRILDCCERGHYLGVKYIVFHAGYYGKHNEKECYKIIKKGIQEMQRVIKKKGWKVKLAPETTGKASQFGSLDELLKLVRETKCHFCIDFAHMLARVQGKINYKEIFEKIKRFSYIHSHFSGIEWTKAGERRHLVTPESRLRELLRWIKRYNLSITIINESPNPYRDSLKGLKVWKSIK
ncbi:MAG: TIM barrel protein [Candidatus Pacearchaeota archaeon]|nr:MAG: TIM barrel protein [Candidatus Pacearchaeota archaeon]